MIPQKSLNIPAKEPYSSEKIKTALMFPQKSLNVSAKGPYSSFCNRVQCFHKRALLFPQKSLIVLQEPNVSTKEHQYLRKMAL